MRSRPSLAACALWLAAATALPAAGVAAAATATNAPATAPAAAPAGTPLEGPAVRAAVRALRDDPLMGGEHKAHRLRWRDEDEPGQARQAGWWLRLVKWLSGAAAWLAHGARWLLIVAVAIGAAVLGVVLWRTLRRRAPARAPEVAPPTHVRGLDIRPEALPADVPSAARALWAAGEQRAALVLLYRALLSRLAHGWQVPVRDSSTEGDCLRLARGRVPEAPLAFVGRFLGAWQGAAYAGHWPDAAGFESLVEGFGPGGSIAP